MTETKYRIGVIGFAHMHVNHLMKVFADHPRATLTAGADLRPLVSEVRDAPSTRNWNVQRGRELGLERVYPDYRTLLAEEELDLVICCAENARHGEVVEACAAKGLPVVLEKPMAATLSEALGMARAARAAGTALIVNWPVTWNGALRTAHRLVSDGAIGRILQVKWRGGHLGPLGHGVSHPSMKEKGGALSGPERGRTWWHRREAGGGAMLDYCCYGSLVARLFAGEQATGVMGMRANLNSPWGDAEDNGAMLIRFPHALAICEASWTTIDHGVPPGPILYGTEGTLFVEGKTGDAALQLIRRDDRRRIDPDPLPEGRTNIAQAWIAHVEEGEPLHHTLDLDFNLQVMAILDAGLRSAESGSLEPVQNEVWQIG